MTTTIPTDKLASVQFIVTSFINYPKDIKNNLSIPRAMAIANPISRKKRTVKRKEMSTRCRKHDHDHSLAQIINSVAAGQLS
jgi:hypothetical protein